MSMGRDDGNRKWNFTEVLLWKEPVESSIGSLGTLVGAELKKLRCSMNARRSDEIALQSGGSETGRVISNYYSLVTWTGNLAGLKKDQECTLSKIGGVRVVSIQPYGDYAIQSEIMVEVII